MDIMDLLVAFGVNVLLAAAAYRGGGVRGSGVLGGILVGVPIYLGFGWRGFLVLVGMFVIGTGLTRLGYAKKQAIGAAEEKRGARGASHALANAGVAALAAIGHLLWPDPLWAVAFTGALATSAMDTAGSEIGPLWGRRTISLKDGRPVPPGTEGAVSLEGTLAGLAVAGVLALLAGSLGLVGRGAGLGVVGGALGGNLYEGILGSRRLLPHTWLNATNTLVGALLAVLATLLPG
jgi:uncharacterized protein (TIGR00297 family)